MSHSSTRPSPNSLPACFSLSLAVGLLHALQRPIPKQPAVNRSRLDGVFALIRELAPRDLIEAHLVQQIAIMMERAPYLLGLASAHQGDLKAFERFERLGKTTTRCMLRLMDRLREHRRDGRPAVEGAPWEYDPAAMEAIWHAGVEVEKAAVPKAGIAVRDDTGEALVPSDGVETTGDVALPVLSRQQRRAMERMQAKAVRREAVRDAVAARALAA